MTEEELSEAIRVEANSDPELRQMGSGKISKLILKWLPFIMALFGMPVPGFPDPTAEAE